MEPVKVMLVGAGSRGMFVYAQYAKQNPQMMNIVSVVEPNETKRKKMQEEHGIPDNYAFTDYKAAFEKLPPVEAVIIATQDKLHSGPLEKAIEANLHIICEKPIVPSAEECRVMEKKAASYRKVFMTGYVLRYNPFFIKIKDLVNTGVIGRLVGINLTGCVGHIDISHGYVRGFWRRMEDSSPMMLAKSCHDMDILYWLSGSACESMNSYGDLHFFRAENAPKGAPLRCLDGCPHEGDCPWYVGKIYMTENTGWPANVITTDLSMEGRLKALKEGPFGRCVFHCDNNVVDHQIVSMKFQNGVKATFTMSGFTMKSHRTISLFGTKGEINCDLEERGICINEFSSRNKVFINISEDTSKHMAHPAGGSGDFNLAAGFVNSIRNRGGENESMVADAFEGHFMALAAEASRIDNGRLIMLEDYKNGRK